MKKFLATLMVFSMMLALYPQSVFAHAHGEAHMCTNCNGLTTVTLHAR